MKKSDIICTPYWFTKTTSVDDIPMEHNFRMIQPISAHQFSRSELAEHCFLHMMVWAMKVQAAKLRPTDSTVVASDPDQK